jgi:hypothetical protein
MARPSSGSWHPVDCCRPERQVSGAAGPGLASAGGPDRRAGRLVPQGLVGGQGPLQGLVGGCVSRVVLRGPGVRVVLAEAAAERLMHLGGGGVRWHPEFGVRVGLG